VTLEEIGLAVVRIEGKLDLLGSRIERVDGPNGILKDYEARIRSLEGRSVVTTKMFWSALVGIAAFVGSMAEVLYVFK
jgi:hypothetical protein